MEQQNFLNICAALRDEYNEAEANLKFFKQILDGLNNDSRETECEWAALVKLKQTLKDFNLNVDFAMDEYDRKANEASVTKQSAPQTLVSDVNNRSDSISPSVLRSQQLRQTQMINNSIGCCEISHIVDPKKCICYLIDVNSATIPMLEAFWQQPSTQFHKMNILPEYHVNFGIDINGELHRARLEYDSEKNAKVAHLIDCGETIPVDMNFRQNCKIFELEPPIKLIPDLASLCKIVKIGSNTTPIELIDSIKYRKFHFKVMEFNEKDNISHIRIFTKNPFLMGFDAATNFEKVECNDADELKYEEAKNAEMDDFNFNLDRSMDKVAHSKIEIESAKSFSPNVIYNSNYDLIGKTRTDSSKNQIDIMLNKPHFDAHPVLPTTMASEMRAQTTNAPTTPPARMGRTASVPPTAAAKSLRESQKSISIKSASSRPSMYNMQLQKSCNLANSGTVNETKPTCINGNVCQVTKTNDRRRDDSGIAVAPLLMSQCRTIHAENYDRRVLPADFNEPITIIPSSVLNGREFYAQLATQHNSFSLLHIQLNSKARITKHKKIPPTESIDVGKYVLTLLDDGKFYRTKVIDYAGNRKITVFTLDFGTTHIVDINHMYFDTPSFFDLPFQAILCTLANIIVKEDREADAINYLNENFLNIPLCVDVKNKNGQRSLNVHMMDDTGFDIGETLIALECATTNNA